MKKIAILTNLLVLASCGGGTGTNSASPSEIDIKLKELETLFGKNNGLTNNPTALIERIDNAGFSYLSFGGWGQVYDAHRNRL